MDYTIMVPKVENGVVLDEEYQLGTVTGQNPGEAYVNALRLYIHTIPISKRPDRFRLEREDGTHMDAVRWGRTNSHNFIVYYWDLMRKDTDSGFAFRIKERNIKHRNAYDIVWEPERYAPIDD